MHRWIIGLALWVAATTAIAQVGQLPDYPPRKVVSAGASNNCGGTGPIANDNVVAVGSGGNWAWGSTAGAVYTTVNMTVSGANRLLLIAFGTYVGETALSAVWNGSEALTKVRSQAGAVEGNTQNTEIWRLIAPSTGSHAVAVTFSAAPSFATGVLASYTGVNQTAPIFSSAGSANNSAATSFALGSTTTGGGNCWLAGTAFTRGGAGGGSNPVTFGAGTTFRQAQGDQVTFVDSGGTVAAGTPTLNYLYASGTNTTPGAITVALAPTP